MELNQLLYFRLLAYGNTMQQVAEQLNISQSALSMSLKRLEQEFDTSFFDRSGRTLKLNEKGKLLLNSAEKILNEVDRLNAVFRTSPEKVQATVTVYADAVDFATDAARVFEELHPEFRVEVIRRNRCLTELVPMPLHGDFVISLEPYLNNTEESRLLLSEPMLLLLPEKELETTLATVSITDLDGCTLVTSREGSALRRLVDSFFFTAQVSPGKMLEVTDPEVLVTFMWDGLGVTFIPSSCCNYRHLQNYARPVREQFCCRNVYMGYLRKEHTPAAVCFRDFLLEFARKTAELDCYPNVEDFGTSDLP